MEVNQHYEIIEKVSNDNIQTFYTFKILNIDNEKVTIFGKTSKGINNGKVITRNIFEQFMKNYNLL